MPIPGPQRVGLVDGRGEDLVVGLAQRDGSGLFGGPEQAAAVIEERVFFLGDEREVRVVNPSGTEPSKRHCEKAWKRTGTECSKRALHAR